MQDEDLGDCVKEIIATVEMNFKGTYASEEPYYRDVEKVLSYIETGSPATRYYLSFIQEKYFQSNDVVSWLTQEQIENSNGQVVELYAYWDWDIDETNWSVIDHENSLGALPKLQEEIRDIEGYEGRY